MACLGGKGIIKKPISKREEMKMKTCVAALSLCLLAATVSPACTDFLVKAGDGTVVVGRSMEFAMAGGPGTSRRGSRPGRPR